MSWYEDDRRSDPRWAEPPEEQPSCGCCKHAYEVDQTDGGRCALLCSRWFDGDLDTLALVDYDLSCDEWESA